MKIRNSSRITAIVLALMMIVPLISVPAFAATKVDGSKATALIAEDFENYEVGANAVGNGLVAGPTKALIADMNGNKVVKYDLTPDTTHRDGAMFIKSSKTGRDSWYTAAVDMTKVTVDPTTFMPLYTGTVAIDGTTYYFTGATMNTANAATPVKLYTDDTYTTEFKAHTYHLCSAAVRNSIQGQTNIAVPSSVGANLTGSTLVLTADYYFDTAIANRIFDLQMYSQANATIPVAHLKTSASGVEVVLHTDVDTKTVNTGVTVPKGQWFTLTVVMECIDGQAVITLYVNGQFAAYGAEAKAFSGTGVKGFNLGHVQRGGNPGDYFGNYYVDNVAVYDTKDVIVGFEEYDPNKILTEKFDSAALPSTMTWGGSQKEFATANGNTYLSLNTAESGNQDKPITLATGAITGGFLQIDTDYYIPSDAQFGFQGQFSQLTGDRSSVPNGTGDVAKAAAITWVDLYFIKVSAGRAWISGLGDSSATANAYDEMVNAELPTDRFFTLSTVIDMATGKVGYFVDGKLAGSMYLYRTDGFMSNLSIADKKLLVAKINKLNTAGFTSFNGSLGVDNIIVKKIDKMPDLTFRADYDYEDVAVGTKIESPSNKPTVAPATAKVVNLLGNKAVQISMLGATEAGEKLETPFINSNARSYDIDLAAKKVDSFEAPETVTLEYLQGLTQIGSIANNRNDDKPMYYAAYVESENTVYVYNNGGQLATEANVAGFWLEKHVLSDDNYNAMYRAMCQGNDANIDKNLRVAHPALNKAGTYVMSADYFVANDAMGTFQSQFYALNQGSKWVDLYQLNLTDKTFNSLGAVSAGKGGQKLLVDEWNTVTLVVTVADDGNLTTSVDVYLNGVYCFTRDIGLYVEADSWILFKLAKPALANVKNLAGFAYLDNVKVMAEDFDANKIVTVNGKNILGFEIDGKTGIVNTSNDEALKLYVNDAYTAITADAFLASKLNGIINTVDAASIKLTEKTGLRFATEINVLNIFGIQNLIDRGLVKGYCHGTLIAPTNALDNGALTFDNYVAGETMLNVKSTLGKYYDVDGDENTTHFVGSIVNILPENLDREFTGVGYFGVQLFNGETYYVYGDGYSISVQDQAQKTLDAGIYAEGTDAYNVLVGFAGPQV